MLVNSAITRGCGQREEGGLYACVSGGGDTPIEQFIIDPVIPWTHGPFQGGIVSYQPASGGYDLIMWVGAEYYPYVPDFIEEGRVHGFSKRIPTTLEGLELLDDQSRLVLIHPKAGFDHTYHLKHLSNRDQEIAQNLAVPIIVRPDHSAVGDCNHPIDCDTLMTNCTFSLWDLSGHRNAAQKGHEVCQNPAFPQLTEIKTPSARYSVRNLVEGYNPLEHTTDLGWYPGIFCVLPLTHFEYVCEDPAVPGNVADKLGDNITRTFTTPT